MIEKQASKRTGKVDVTFRVNRSVWADQVSLVGDFNGWDCTGLPLVRTGYDPDWHVTVELDANRRYRFGYVLDGEWRSDHQADGDMTDADGRVYSVVDTSLDRLMDSYESQVSPALLPLLLNAA